MSKAPPRARGLATAASAQSHLCKRRALLHLGGTWCGRRREECVCDQNRRGGERRADGCGREEAPARRERRAVAALRGGRARACVLLRERVERRALLLCGVLGLGAAELAHQELAQCRHVRADEHLDSSEKANCCCAGRHHVACRRSVPAALTAVASLLRRSQSQCSQHISHSHVARPYTLLSRRWCRWRGQRGVHFSFLPSNRGSWHSVGRILPLQPPADALVLGPVRPLARL